MERTQSEDLFGVSYGDCSTPHIQRTRTHHNVSSSWGRILCAVGYSPLSAPSPSTSPAPLEIDPTRVSVSFLPPKLENGEPLHVLVRGEPEIVDEARASELLALPEIVIEIDLGLPEGGESATYWTCDFSHVSTEFCR